MPNADDTRARAFLDATPMRALLGIPPEVMDHFMASAYQLYQDGRYLEAEFVCRGLIAADHRYWYPYSLYAATLQKLGRFEEALGMLEVGLRYEPRQPRLLALRQEILRSLARLRAQVPKTATPSAASAVQQEAA